MTAPVERVTARSDSFVIEAVPERGASLTRFAWRAPDGAWRELMHRPVDAEIDDRALTLSKLSSFLMLPFANRIDGAAFTFEGARHRIPLNRPQQDCAIHGFSREQAWTVVEAAPDRVLLEDAFQRAETPYAYVARQVLTAEEDGGRIEVSVENRGPTRLPFGFGLHPWFPRGAETTLSFEATTTFDADERTFPTAAVSVSPETGFDGTTPVEARIGLDRHYAGWSRAARIEHPEEGWAMELTAEGAFTNLHIFVAEDRPLFCVEPVTHVTDVVNRRAFAEYGDMTALAPGETLAGAVAFRVSALAG